jgi:putative peptidoglycan lipid II flippase
MFGLVPFGLVFMFQKAFFALEDTRTPFIFTTIQIAINIAGSITLFFTMTSEFLVMSLAGLTSVTILIQALVAYLFLRARIGQVGTAPKGEGLTLRVLAAAVAAALVGYGMIVSMGGTAEGSLGLGSIAGAITVIFATGSAMLLAYVVVLKLLGVPEIDSALKGIRGILRR